MNNDSSRPAVRVLSGTVSVTRSDGGVVELHGKTAILLSYLVSRAGSPATVNEIIEVVWPEDRGSGSVTQKRVEQVVSEVRELFKPRGRELIPQRKYDRYRLVTDAEHVWVDAVEFDRLAGAARASLQAGDPSLARAQALEALELWQSDPVVLAAEWKRLHERRQEVRLTAAEASLVSGEYDRAAQELFSYVEDYDADERGWELRVGALSASGQVADARRACLEARSRLADHGGIGPRLARMCAELAGAGEGPVDTTLGQKTPDPKLEPIGAQEPYRAVARSADEGGSHWPTESRSRERSGYKRLLYVLPVVLALCALAFFATTRPSPPDPERAGEEVPVHPPLPEIRTCAGQTISGVAFSGETYEKGVAIRAGAAQDFQVLDRLPGGCRVGFVGYCLGETVKDYFHGLPDMRWFVLPDNRGVIASAVIKDNPARGLLPMPCLGSRPAPATVTLSAVPGPTSSAALVLSADAPGAPIVGFAAAQVDVTGASRLEWKRIGWDFEPNDGLSLNWETAPFLVAGGGGGANVLIAAVACVARDVPTEARAFVSLQLSLDSAPVLSDATPPVAPDVGAGAGSAACRRP